MTKPSEVTQFKIVNSSIYLSTWNNWGTPVVRPSWIIWRGLKMRAVRKPRGADGGVGVRIVSKLV